MERQSDIYSEIADTSNLISDISRNDFTYI